MSKKHNDYRNRRPRPNVRAGTVPTIPEEDEGDELMAMMDPEHDRDECDRTFCPACMGARRERDSDGNRRYKQLYGSATVDYWEAYQKDKGLNGR